MRINLDGGILMFLLVFVIFFSLSYTPSLLAQENDCINQLNNINLEKYYKIECDIDNVIKKINSTNSENAPNVIYHWGKRKHMLENASVGNISQAVWNKFIMGEATTWHLAPLRRGFYGTINFINDFTDYASHDDYWFNEITIKPQCIKKDSVISIKGLIKNSRFKVWMDKKFSKNEKIKFYSKCLDQDKEITMNMDGKFVPFGKPEEDSTGYCEPLILKFINEMDIKIILDHEIQNSWYIRDRNCIEKIKGTYNHTLDILINRKINWSWSCKNQLSEFFYKPFYHILFSTLSNYSSEKYISDSNLNKLEMNIRNSSFESCQKSRFLEMLDAYRRCKKKNFQIKQSFKKNELQNVCR